MIACALSGGVDSAVSLHLLLKRLPRRLIKAVFMKNWNEGGDQVCPFSEDLKSAQEVAEHLDVELHTVDFSKQYWLQVFEPMLVDYSDGITPNPDVLCNQYIKFDRMLQYCQTKLGVEKIATGHYARLRQHNEKMHLLRGVDRAKDQTFFLAAVRREALKFVEFPVGELPKRRVKEIAIEMGMPSLARRKESTGICFIGKRKFRDFIGEYVEPQPGNFIDVDSGTVVGHHKGKHYWTVGQRAHLESKDKRYYIARMTAGADVMVCKGNSHPSLLCDSLWTRKPHWINERFRGCKGAFTFKTQHTDPVARCRVVETSSNGLKIQLCHFKRAITPGQHVVLYDGEECVGSAKIEKLGPSLKEVL
ncbi:mitochondrial tRNA-specific 2-thiouridylase 1-like [Tropilaelaps mercedesae]|uniref:tRNA-5-taurinomethyluridine 2-sulfurtransferase n=1 Tax=Tropilaelaps mercedesae TaxID=418985 RepID=A0A1V9X2F7_9ACAR|nr:mitochondrial tRNA-specific 2-thiouridylase 1-like [Tropilaelaps mercedesae]